MSNQGHIMTIDQEGTHNILRFFFILGAESPYLIGSGILGFGKDGAGRDVAEKCAYQLQR